MAEETAQCPNCGGVMVRRAAEPPTQAMRPALLAEAQAFKARGATIGGLIEQLRETATAMEERGVDSTYMRGKIAGLEIAQDFAQPTGLAADE